MRGDSEDEWKGFVEAAASVDKHKRGRDDLPAWLQGENLTQWEHAVDRGKPSNQWRSIYY